MLSLHPGSFCDFESDSCGWHEYGFAQGDGFDWVRGSAMTIPLDHQGQIPPLDHSTNSSQGRREVSLSTQHHTTLQTAQ